MQVCARRALCCPCDSSLASAFYPTSYISAGYRKCGWDPYGQIYSKVLQEAGIDTKLLHQLEVLDTPTLAIPIKGKMGKTAGMQDAQACNGIVTGPYSEVQLLALWPMD